MVRLMYAGERYLPAVSLSFVVSKMPNDYCQPRYSRWLLFCNILDQTNTSLFYVQYGSNKGSKLPEAFCNK